MMNFALVADLFRIKTGFRMDYAHTCDNNNNNKKLVNGMDPEQVKTQCNAMQATRRNTTVRSGLRQCVVVWRWR